MWAPIHHIGKTVSIQIINLACHSPRPCRWCHPPRKKKNKRPQKKRTKKDLVQLRCGISKGPSVSDGERILRKMALKFEHWHLVAHVHFTYCYFVRERSQLLLSLHCCLASLHNHEVWSLLFTIRSANAETKESLDYHFRYSEVS